MSKVTLFETKIVNKMMALNNFVRVRKYFLILVSIICLSTSYVFSQTNLKPVSICELMQNKKKYSGKKVVIESIWHIAAESSTFQFEENCSTDEILTVGTHETFKTNNEFEKQTDLLSLQMQAEKKLGFSFLSLMWSTVLRVKIRAEGELKVSNKPKYGHLGSYRNAFLITKVEEIGKSELLFVGDSYRNNSKIIVRNEND